MVIRRKFKKRFVNQKRNMLPFTLLLGFYVWHAIGLLYSDNVKTGLFDLEIKMSIFVFPIILIGVNSLYYDKQIIIFKSFIIGNFIAAILCLCISLYTIVYGFGFNDIIAVKKFFLYAGLSFFIHPSYFAMYLVLCLALIEYIHYFKLLTKKSNKFFYYFLTLFFIIFIYILSSKAGIISFIFLCFWVFIFNLLKIKKWHNKVLFIIIFLTLLILTLNNPRFMLFLKNDYEKKNPENINMQLNNTTKEISTTDESTNMRLFIWKSAMNISADNIIFGVGTGDIKTALMIEYIKNKNTNAEKNKYNVHNQFLETQMGQGIIGFILLISLFVLAIWRSFIDKNRLLFLFIIIIGLNFLLNQCLIHRLELFFLVFSIAF